MQMVTAPGATSEEETHARVISAGGYSILREVLAAPQRAAEKEGRLLLYDGSGGTGGVEAGGSFSAGFAPGSEAERDVSMSVMLGAASSSGIVMHEISRRDNPKGKVMPCNGSAFDRAIALPGLRSKAIERNLRAAAAEGGVAEASSVAAALERGIQSLSSGLNLETAPTLERELKTLLAQGSHSEAAKLLTEQLKNNKKLAAANREPLNALQ